ncbi:hypothetical protein OH77DRAFT_1427196 [Trametes cingulata]|nr:hypothetical protein OH77DRAFT_1427196 [Trametes cingulata]
MHVGTPRNFLRERGGTVSSDSPGAHSLTGCVSQHFHLPLEKASRIDSVPHHISGRGVLETDAAVMIHTPPWAFVAL